MTEKEFKALAEKRNYDNARKYVDYFRQRSGLTIIVHFLDVIICKGVSHHAPIVKRFSGDDADKFLHRVTELNERIVDLDECFERAMVDYEDLCDVFKWLKLTYPWGGGF